MVAKAESVGLVKGFPFRVGLSVPFIQFADNSLFMLNVDLEGMQNPRCILLIMETATSLKVNWGKSTLSPVGSTSNDGELAGVLNCNVEPLPISYFSLPLGAKYFSKIIWNPVIERMS